MFQRFLTPKPKISLSCPKLVAPPPVSLITINIYQYPFNFLACFPTSNLFKKLYNSIYFHFSFLFKSIYIHINIYINIHLCTLCFILKWSTLRAPKWVSSECIWWWMQKNMSLLPLFNKWCWNSLISTCKKKKIKLQSIPCTKYENSFKLDPRYKCKV